MGYTRQLTLSKLPGSFAWGKFGVELNKFELSLSVFCQYKLFVPTLVVPTIKKDEWFLYLTAVQDTLISTLIFYCYEICDVNPDGIFLSKVNNRITRTMCEICSKLTIIKIPGRRFWCLYC